MEPRTVKFADLRVEDEHIHNTVINVLKSGQFIFGQWVEEFANLWSEECNAMYCVPCASGSAALTASLRAMHKRKGSFVIVPALTFAATTFSVYEAGYKPVYVDVTMNGLLDLDQAKEAIKASGAEIVLPVHLFGQVMNLYPILDLNVKVIEDACQAHGGIKQIQGETACFSFYPAKNLGACGDAGAVVTNDKDIADYCWQYISYGDRKGKKYDHQFHGTNARMDNIQAAILCEKIYANYLGQSNAQRTINAVMYYECGVPSAVGLEGWVKHQYPILTSDPALLAAKLKARGIDSGQHYPYTLPDIDMDGAVFRDCKNAWYLSRHLLSLPIAPHLEVEDICYVADVLKEVAVLQGNEWVVKE